MVKRKGQMKIFDKKTSIWKRRWNSLKRGYLSESGGKLEAWGKKVDLAFLGVSSAIGILTLSWVGVLIINYLFISSKEYSKLILVIFYTMGIFIFWDTLKSLNKYFKKGYFWMAIIAILIFVIGTIISGPKLR